MTDQELIELRERNAIRLQEAIAKLGNKWLLHPDNAARKQKSNPAHPVQQRVS
jgi:hypothetical protein